MKTPMASSAFPFPAFRKLLFQGRQSLDSHPLLWLLGSLLLIRCGFILMSPLDLIADESYYWDWSRRLDYGYYSKPPMIAWINWISTSLLGASEFAVRFPAALLGTLGLVWVYLLGAKLFSFRVGLYSIILMALTPGQTALSFLMTIDVPFLFCWVAALYCFWMMTSEKTVPWQWCLLTALWLAGGILSKQIMLAFFPLAGLFLLTSRTRRHLLWSGPLWLTAGLGLLAIVPVLHWNARHDWITFQHTASHFEEGSVTFSTQMIRSLEFLLGQMGVMSPVLWIVLVITLVAAFRVFPRLSDGERYLLCFSGVPLIGILLLSLTRRLEPNWPAACYPAGIILTTAVLLGRSTLVDLFQNRERQLQWSLRTGLICSLLTYAAITVVPASPLAGSAVDVTARLRGWKELAVQLENLRKEAVPAGEQPLIIATAGRDITSALAFYLKDQPLISLWSKNPQVVNSQYDLWDRPDLSQYNQVLVIADSAADLPESLQQADVVWSPLGELAVDLGNARQRRYQVLQGIPATSKLLLKGLENTAERPANTTPEAARIQ